MTKSRVVSTEGAAASVSGANWTFLIISFRLLLHTDASIRDNAWTRLLRFESSSPLANFSVLALRAEGFDLKLNGALLQREEESPSAFAFTELRPLVFTLPTS